MTLSSLLKKQKRKIVNMIATVLTTVILFAFGYVVFVAIIITLLEIAGNI